MWIVKGGATMEVLLNDIFIEVSRALFIGAFMAVGIFLGSLLRKNKNKKTEASSKEKILEEK